MARHANGRIGRQQGPGAAVATVTRAAGSKRAVDVHRGLAHAATPMGSPQGAPGPADPAPGLALATLDRRRFLVVLGGAAALHALAPSLSLARRAAGTLPRLQPWTLPDLLPTNPIEAGRALVGAAVLAPSHWNAQPWRFEVDADELRVLLDPTRVLPLDDPDQRFAQMSIGAALENLLVAARAWGQQPAARYLPWGTAPRPGSSLVAAAVSWKPAERPRDRLLFLALPDRRTNPHPYDGPAIPLPSRGRSVEAAGAPARSAPVPAAHGPPHESASLRRPRHRHAQPRPAPRAGGRGGTRPLARGPRRHRRGERPGARRGRAGDVRPAGAGGTGAMAARFGRRHAFARRRRHRRAARPRRPGALVRGALAASAKPPLRLGHREHGEGHA